MSNVVALHTALSLATETAVRCLADPTPGVSYPPPTEAVVAEANRVLPAFERALTPITPELLDRWLKPLVFTIPKPPSSEERRVFATTMAFALVDVPSCALTAESQRELIQESTWWPSGEEVTKLLRKAAAPTLARLRALRTLAKAAPPPASAPEPILTDEERDAVLAEFRTKMAAVRADHTGPIGSTDGKPALKSACFSPELLLASYEQLARQGGPMADGNAARVAGLRKQLGRE